MWELYMAIDVLLKRLFFAVLLLLAPFSLCADEGIPSEQMLAVTPNAKPLDAASGVYSFVRVEDGESKFIQHISWQSVNHVRRYEIIIERETDSAWTQVLRESTRETFVELSLEGGSYRYRVIVYDLLNRPHNPPPWRHLTVITIQKPEITGFSPIQIVLDASAEYRIVVTGRNFFSAAQVFLIDRGSKKIITPVLAQVDSNFKTLVLTFNAEQLVPGNYEIHIINPGELGASAETLSIKLPYKNLFMASAGYAPLMPFPDDQVFAFFSQAFVPVGAYMRFGALPLKLKPLSIGGEISAIWNYLSTETEEMQAQANTITGRLNAIAQIPLPKETMFINARFGAGITSFVDFHFQHSQYSSPSFTVIYVSTGGEASFQWFPFPEPSFFSPMFVEAGVGYTHVFTPDESADIDFMTLFIGIGARF
jgi:hypothetical protein